MSDLRIAKGFALPLELVTEATAIVATRGAGKSSASAVIVEEAFAIGVQAVIFDRTGVYWGLRSDESGTKAGLGVYVLGGPHGDVPLEPHAGAMIADLVVDSGHSFVLDLSDLSKGGAVKFSAAFLERLYDRKARSRSTTLLVIDEAHFYAPQTPRGGFKGDAATLMGAMEDVVGLGRSRGLGVVMTTQRTQALNKAVLDLIETLLVMRMLSPRARDAVRDWILVKGEEDEHGVIKTLDSLPDGTAWVWSPLRGILEKVAVRRIKTFNSYATPKAGEVLIEPSARAELDLTALGEEMAATVERAKANDPAELRRQVVALRRELAERPAEVKQVEVVREVEVPAISDEEWARLEALAERLEGYAERSVETALDAREALGGFASALVGLRREQKAGRPTGATARPLAPAAPTSPRDAPPLDASPFTSPLIEEIDRPTRENGRVELGTTSRRILETIVRRYPAKLTPSQVAQMLGVKARGGNWNSAVSALRKGGYLDEMTSAFVPTDLALAEAGVTPEGLTLDHWRDALPMTANRILDEIVRTYPRALAPDEVAATLGVKPTGGNWNSAVATLLRNGLVERTSEGLRAAGIAAE